MRFKIDALYEERESLLAEIEYARELYDCPTPYDEEDAVYECLPTWGDVLRAERRVSEIDDLLEEISPR
jgi:hypothetical protein